MPAIGRIDPEISGGCRMAGPAGCHRGREHERSVLVRAEKLLGQVDQDELRRVVSRWITLREGCELRQRFQPVGHLDPDSGTDVPPIDAVEAGHGPPGVAEEALERLTAAGGPAGPGNPGIARMQVCAQPR
jgi:hypothetical protein